jgi:hypothetical protein
MMAVNYMKISLKDEIEDPSTRLLDYERENGTVWMESIDEFITLLKEETSQTKL